MENFDQILKLLTKFEGIGLNIENIDFIKDFNIDIVKDFIKDFKIDIVKDFELNTNILETGLINILALIVVIIAAFRMLLTPVLEKRKTNIGKNLQDAEDRLNEARKRLTEARKQSDQIYLLLIEIIKETNSTRQELLEFHEFQTKKDLTLIFERGLEAFRSYERKVFSEIKQDVISVVLRRTLKRVKETFKSKECAEKLINETINALN